MPVWVVAALLSDMDLLGVCPWDPGDLPREETLGGAMASEQIPATRPPKALGAGCSPLRFRSWHLLFGRLQFYLLF